MEQIIHLGLTLHQIDIVKKPILNIVVIFSKLMAGSEIVPTEKNQGTTNRYWSARSWGIHRSIWSYTTRKCHDSPKAPSRRFRLPWSPGTNKVSWLHGWIHPNNTFEAQPARGFKTKQLAKKKWHNCSLEKWYPTANPSTNKRSTSNIKFIHINYMYIYIYHQKNIIIHM